MAAGPDWVPPRFLLGETVAAEALVWPDCAPWRCAHRFAGRGRRPMRDRRLIVLLGFVAMSISREQVLHVARLARLDLTDDELDRLTGELGDILAAVSKVSELDLADVPPTSHPLDLVNVYADDEPRPSLDLEAALANAPARVGGLFRVPPTA
jgi:aspartyl-tRNA(Asn)/glutamyl-tRNA(Gln) amidotransferase subunit C